MEVQRVPTWSANPSKTSEIELWSWSWKDLCPKSCIYQIRTISAMFEPHPGQAQNITFLYLWLLNWSSSLSEGVSKTTCKMIPLLYPKYKQKTVQMTWGDPKIVKKAFKTVRFGLEPLSFNFWSRGCLEGGGTGPKWTRKFLQNRYKNHKDMNLTKYGNQKKHLEETMDYVATLLEQMPSCLQKFPQEFRNSLNACNKTLVQLSC